MPSSFKDTKFNLGMNQHNSEDAIPEGYIYDADNMDVTGAGYLKKRTGYEGSLSNLPIRIDSYEIDHTTGKMHLHLPAALNVANYTKTNPLMLVGRASTDIASSNGGDMTATDSVQWYDDYELVNLTRTLTAAGSSITITAAEHGISSANLVVEITERQTGEVSGTDNSKIMVDSYQINKSSYLVTVNYSVAVDTEVFVIIKEIAATDYTKAYNAHNISTTDIALPQSTHSLSSRDLVVYVYEDDGTNYNSIIPDTITVDPVTGDVDITFDSTITSIDLFVMVQEVANAYQGSIGGATDTFTVSGLTGDFIITQVYIEGSLVIPDSIVVDADDAEVTVTILGADVGSTIKLLWQYATLRVGEIGLTPNDTATTSDATDASCWLFLYGLDSIEDHGSGARLGWVNHIDSYNTRSQNRLITGMGGNLFQSVDSTDTSIFPTGFIPSPTIDTAFFVDAQQVITPVFIASADASYSNYYLDASVSGGFIRATSITWNGTYTEIAIDASSMTENGTAIDTSYMQLLVQGANWEKHNGTYDIISATIADGVLTIVIDNSNITSTDWDDSDTGAEVGVFQRKVTINTSASSNFRVGDLVIGGAIQDSAILTVKSFDTGYGAAWIVLDGVDEALLLKTTAEYHTKNTSTLIPLSAVTNIVEGDMVRVSTLPLVPLRVTAIDTTNKVITVDTEVTYTGMTDTIALDGRFFPIDTPKSDDTNVDATDPILFDTNSYAAQSILRSSTAADCMFLTNGDDEVFKFDGVSAYQAGLIPWQAGAFMMKTATGGLGTIERPVSVGLTAVTGYSHLTTSQFALQGEFAEGDRVQIKTGAVLDSTVYTVTKVAFDGSATYYIWLDQKHNTTGGVTVYKLEESVYRYYYRLHAIDSNNNIIVSAAAQSDDYKITLTEAGGIIHRLLAPGNWGMLDHDKIFLQIYRTKANGNTFYKVDEVSITFSDTYEYIDYVDTKSDQELYELDSTMSALKGAELGTAWNRPQRAKYVTSLNNQLVLGNISLDAEADLLFRPSSESAADFTGSTITVDDEIYEFVNTSTSATITDMTIDASNAVITVPGTYAVGDIIYLTGVNNASPLIRMAGWFVITAQDGGTTITVASPAGITPTATTAWVANTDVDTLYVGTTQTNIPVVLHPTASTDANYAQDIGNLSTTISYMTLMTKRLAIAINRFSRDVAYAIAGADLDIGRLLIRSPGGSITIEASLNGSNLISLNNGGLVASLSSEATEVKHFPSRLLVSYQNYPEVFDNVGTSTPNFSDSVIDVNSSDGQEITGILPFFGESAFEAAQTAGSLIVFKERSIYLVDLNAKRKGTGTIIQRLDSRGIGCAYPYSIVNANQGVMFATTEGIFKVGRNLAITQISEPIERLYDDTTKTLVSAHHDTTNQTYEVSFLDSSSTVLVYNHEGEGRTQEYGAWMRYTNFPALGWVSHLGSIYFAGNNGRIYRRRRDNSGLYAFRDDSAAIVCYATLRGQGFGDATRRKHMPAFVCGFRNLTAMDNTTLYSATELRGSFSALDSLTLLGQEGTSNFYDMERPIVSLVKFSTRIQKFNYVQIKITNSGDQEDLQFTGIIYRVTGLTRIGIEQALETGDANGN